MCAGGTFGFVAERRVAGKPAAGKPAGGRAAGNKPAGNKPAGGKPARDRPAEGKQAPDRPAEGKQAPDRPAEGKQAPGTSAGAASAYPGQRFGLPQSGPRSVAGVARRLGSLMIDWVMAALIALAVLGDKNQASVQYLTLAIFAGEIWLLTALTGFTVGKRLLGMRVARLDGQPVGFYRSLIRTVLFLLVVPPLVLDADLRGLHDKAAGTIVIRV
jgi:uncharacterized RDD family membrane protein YckC